MNRSRPVPAQEPIRFECHTCGRHEVAEGELPEGWELRAAGHLHVQICGYCIPAWENRPRYARISMANDADTVLVVHADDGKAWIALDRSAHPDKVAAFTGIGGRTRGWRVHPDVRLSHWPMPELGGAAILFAGDGDRDGILFAPDARGLDDLIAELTRIREGLAS